MTLPPTSAPESPARLRVRDPLSDITRKERRAFLGVSLLGVVIQKTGLIPTEISSLGVKFGSTDQRALLLVLAAVTGYFLVAFIIYAASDFLAWWLALRAAIRDSISRNESLDEFDKDKERSLDARLLRSYPLLERTRNLIRIVSAIRAAFEFVLPIIFGVYAISLLQGK